MASVRSFELGKENELRVEVGEKAPLKLKLASGSAEIFGTELPPDCWLLFAPEQKFAVFSWKGAIVELDGKADAYLVDETPMVSYLNVHAILDNRRKRCREAATVFPSGPLEQPHPHTQGPRVMVVGPTDSGKSSLVKMLLSWAVRSQHKPMFVDLDIGQGSITIPGTVAATPVHMPIDPVEGIVLDVPLVYYFGHTTPSVNASLYQALVNELARKVDLSLAANAEIRTSGVVINTMGWVDGLGYELLLQAIDAFGVNVILVLGQEKVYSMLQDHLRARPGVDIVKLQKSGGVVVRPPKYRQRCRLSRIKQYFYGRSNDLSPYSNSVSFSDVKVFRIGGGPQAPRSALPIGAEPSSDPTRLVQVNISKDLVHAVLGVSCAKDPDQLLQSNVAGFVHVSDVDLVRKKLTLVQPVPGSLPGNLLIAGSLLSSTEL